MFPQTLNLFFTGPFGPKIISIVIISTYKANFGPKRLLTNGPCWSKTHLKPVTNKSYSEKRHLVQKPGIFDRFVLKTTKSCSIKYISECSLKNKTMVFRKHRFSKLCFSENSDFQNTCFRKTMIFKTVIFDKTMVLKNTHFQKTVVLKTPVLRKP